MLELPVTLAGLFVGLVVGMTGMGGGALMTPVLVLVFGMQPLAAVSSDLVASMFMKPIGAAVHFKRKTVHRQLVLWLVLGSVPSAFLGVFLLQTLGTGHDIQHSIKRALGVALLVVVLALFVRPLIARSRAPESTPGSTPVAISVKPLSTLLIGVAGGLIVGLTSVGSGSLMIMMLLMLYPSIRLSELVGTDLVQAVPLVASAALAHLLFGDFQMSVTASILLGSIPGIYLGARISSRAPDHAIRPLLAVVLVASALKLLGASNLTVGILVGLLSVAGVAHFSVHAQKSARARTATEA